MRTSSEIMTEARASLNGKWGNMVLVTILLILIMGAAGFTYVGYRTSHIRLLSNNVRQP